MPVSLLRLSYETYGTTCFLSLRILIEGTKITLTETRDCAKVLRSFFLSLGEHQMLLTNLSFSVFTFFCQMLHYGNSEML